MYIIIWQIRNHLDLPLWYDWYDRRYDCLVVFAEQ